MRILFTISSLLISIISYAQETDVASDSVEEG